MNYRTLAPSIVLLSTTLVACDSRQPSEPVLPRDTAAPRINLEPRNRTSDGLVELHVTWYDPDRPLLNPLLDISVDGQSITHAWARTGGDGTFLDIKERLDSLLSPGSHQVVATVTDSAGKSASDTLQLDLPYLTLLGSVVADVTSQGPLVSCGDSTSVFLGGLTGVLAVDALKMDYEVVPNPHRHFGNSGTEYLTCANDELALYSANGLQRFDIRTQAWSERLNDGEGYAVSFSKARPHELFVGTSYGVLSSFDRESGTLLRQMRLPGSNPVSQDAIVTIASSLADERIFVTQFADSTYVLDANWALRFRLPFSLNSVAVTGDGTRAFGITPFEPGVVELNPRDGHLLRTHSIPNAWRIDLRYDSKVAFVTTVGRGGVGNNYLMDLRNGGFREAQRIAANTWYRGGAAWLPHLKRLVVLTSKEGSPDHFNIYLDRS